MTATKQMKRSKGQVGAVTAAADLVHEIVTKVLERTSGKVDARGVRRLTRSIRADLQARASAPTMRVSGTRKAASAKSTSNSRTSAKASAKRTAVRNAPILLTKSIPSQAIKAKSGGKTKTRMLGIRAPSDPFVPIERSVEYDGIVCLEDGKKFKMIKRHLRANYGMTPEDYRAKWGLPADYPMVAPGYSAEKSEYAQLQGLGTMANKAGAKTKVKDLQAHLA